MAEKNIQAQNGSNGSQNAAKKHVCEITACKIHVEHTSTPGTKKGNPTNLKYRIHFRSEEELVETAKKYVAWQVNQDFGAKKLPDGFISNGTNGNIVDIYPDITIAETQAMRDAWIASLNAEEKDALRARLQAQLNELLKA